MTRNKLERHEDICKVCKHLQREQMELAYKQFQSWADFHAAFKLSSTVGNSKSMMIRHVNAIGLQRSKKYFLEDVMERSRQSEAKGSDGTKACELLMKMEGDFAPERKEIRHVTSELDKLTDQLTPEQQEELARILKLQVGADKPLDISK